jgi:hypothetical protein
MKWKTKDGREIDLTDLEDAHLINIVKMLKRGGFVHSDTAMSCLSYASTTSAEMASYYAEQAFDEMHFCNETDMVFNELEKRNIGEGNELR